MRYGLEHLITGSDMDLDLATGVTGDVHELREILADRCRVLTDVSGDVGCKERADVRGNFF
jgi:hypothetical protein